jgi:urocanate hydratase
VSEELSREVLGRAIEALEYRASCLFGVDDKACEDDTSAADVIRGYLASGNTRESKEAE